MNSGSYTDKSMKVNGLPLIVSVQQYRRNNKNNSEWKNCH